MVTDTWNGGTASWTTAADWSLGTVPGTDDAVVIGQGEPEIDSAVGTIASLTNMGDMLVEAGGGLTVSSALDNDSNLQMTGGNLTVQGDMQAGGTEQLSGGSLIVDGTLTNTGDCDIQGGATVNVGRGLSSGDDTIDVHDGEYFVVDFDVDASGAGGSRLNVEGAIANDDELTIGNSAMTATSIVTAGSFTQRDFAQAIDGFPSPDAAVLDLNGGATGAAMAILDVTSAAGLSGYVNLSGHALLQFASDEVTTISAGSELTLNGANAFVADASATTSNSALTGLDEIYGSASFRNGASVAVSGGLTVDDSIVFDEYDELLQGSLSIDASSGDGGSDLAVAGALSNHGSVSFGNGSLSSADTLSAASFANAETMLEDRGIYSDYYGSISVTGSATRKATLDIAGAAGFGTTGTVAGGVSLYDDALIEFGSSEITDIAASAQLTLGGSIAYVADASDITSNSALTGLTTVAGMLTLDDGAVVKPTGALTVTGELNVDTGPYGGSLLAIGAGLINQGTMIIGDQALTSSDMVSAASLSNSGTIDLAGDHGANPILATLDIAGAAGFGTGSALTGAVNLADDTLIEFGSNQIASIAANSELTENGRHAFVADASDTTANSALTGLATISGELVLYNGAAVSTSALTIAAFGAVDLDGGAAAGGSSLAVVGTLTNSGTISVGNLGTSSNDSVTATALSNTGVINLASGFSTNTKLLIDGAANNSGTIDDSEYDLVEIAGSLSGDGTINVSDGGELSVGSGGGGGTVAFGAAASSIVVTGGAIFGDVVSGFAGGNTIEFADVAYSAADTVNVASVASGDATFTVDDGANTPVATFTTPDSYSDSQFALSDDGGELLVSYAPTLVFTNAAELPDSTTETLTGTIDAADAGLTIDIYDGATLPRAISTTSTAPTGPSTSPARRRRSREAGTPSSFPAVRGTPRAFTAPRAFGMRSTAPAAPSISSARRRRSPAAATRWISSAAPETR